MAMLRKLIDSFNKFRQINELATAVITTFFLHITKLSSKRRKIPLLMVGLKKSSKLHPLRIDFTENSYKYLIHEII